MTTRLIEIFRQLSQPLTPIATREQDRGRLCAPVRAVLFDIYGTLLISASGDIGTSRANQPAQAAAEALKAVGIELLRPPEEVIGRLMREIESWHEDARQAGIDFPEVNILDVWRNVIAGLHEDGQPTPSHEADFEELAVHFEARANPVWPMPGAAKTLTSLRAMGIALGIVSNAQFFTPLAVTALLGSSPQDLGVRKQLELYSYLYGRAKPDEFLYRMAAKELRTLGIPPVEVVYIGNDMLNDVLPARQCGFQTVLFAGDARSLRWRCDDPRVRLVAPDAVVTSLDRLLELIEQAA